MRIVVTGGAGFIGANLCRVLAPRHDVLVLDDLSTGHEANLSGVDATLRVGSVLDAAMVREVCRGASAIVHLAAIPSVPRSIHDPLRTHETNVTGTLTVLEAARETGAHVVLASSSSVYGGGGAHATDENTVCRPLSPYGVSKLAAESYATAYRTSFTLDTISFRFFNVFGPLQDPDTTYAAVVPTFLRAALRGDALTIHGDGKQSRDFTFVDSVAEVLADAVDRRVTSAGPVNLAFGTRTTLNELADKVAHVAGRALAVRHGPARLGDIRHSRAYPAALRELFPDVRPVPLATGLRRTLAWLESPSGALGRTAEAST